MIRHQVMVMAAQVVAAAQATAMGGVAQAPAAMGVEVMNQRSPSGETSDNRGQRNRRQNGIRDQARVSQS